jgi:hypothetical protein
MDLAAGTAVFSAAMALREILSCVCTQISGYTADQLVLKIKEPVHQEEMASGTFVDSGSGFFTGTIALNTAAIIAKFADAGLSNNRQLKFFMKLYANASGTGSAIVDETIHIMNNPFTAAMEA